MRRLHLLMLLHMGMKERVLLLLHLMIELIFVVFDEFVHVIGDSRVKRVFLLFQTVLVGEHIVSFRLLPQVVKLSRERRSEQNINCEVFNAINILLKFDHAGVKMILLETTETFHPRYSWLSLYEIFRYLCVLNKNRRAFSLELNPWRNAWEVDFSWWGKSSFHKSCFMQTKRKILEFENGYITSIDDGTHSKRFINHGPASIPESLFKSPALLLGPTDWRFREGVWSLEEWDCQNAWASCNICDGEPHRGQGKCDQAVATWNQKRQPLFHTTFKQQSHS